MLSSGQRLSLHSTLFFTLLILMSLIGQQGYFNSKSIDYLNTDSTQASLNSVSISSAAESYERLNTRSDLVSFINVTPTVGLAGVSGNFYAWGDYNNDGNQDLLVNGGRLFKNNGPPDYTFTEVTGEVGLSGAGNGAWADYDNDGFLDLYTTKNDILWHNGGPPSYHFQDVTSQAGNIRNDYPTTAVGWGDFDLDGYLDMYIANGEDWNDGDPIYYPDFMYHNNGNGTFTDITEQSNIRSFGGPYYGRGVSWGDYDDDGWPDIYISNYRISQNWLFHNNRNGTFTDVAIEKGVAGEESQRMGTTYYGHTVGSAWGDLDCDGDLDLFESDLAHKDLYRGPICGDSQIYRNDGPGNNYQFTDVRETSGVPEKSLGGGEDELFVGIAIGDFDNDGFLDLFIPQIYDLEYSYSYLYHNNGDWTFINVSSIVGVQVWNTYGGAWCDYNNDGFIDLVTGGKGSADPNASYEVHLYQNKGNLNSWLQVRLQGKHYNKQCIGVRVSAIANGFTQVRELEGGMGSHSMQNSIPVEFGFGSYTGTVDLEVYWPSGFVQKINDVILNQQLVIEEPHQAPDLSFIKVKVLEQHPIQGDTITIEASVANMGYLDAEYAVVRFYDGGKTPSGIEIAEEQIITNLPKFHSIKVTTKWDTTNQSGEHNIWAVIEDVEPNELVITNNNMNCTVNIRETNGEPVAVLIAKHDDKLLPGDTVLFDGSNSMDDIAVDYYYFDFGDGNSSGWIINSEVEYQYQLSGKFTASLKVRDNDDSISTNLAEVKITVSAPPLPNQPPSIDTFTANPTELYPFETSTLKIVAYDPEDDELTYHVNASAGILKSNEYSSVATWQAPDKEGTYTFTASVSDGELFSETETLTIKVIVEHVNTAPVINNIIIDPPEVAVGTTTTITVQAFDPDDGDILSYYYEAGAGQLTGTGAVVTWVAPETPGAFIIRVTVSDLGGLSVEDEASIVVYIENYPPEILIASAQPSVVTNDEVSNVLFKVEVKDRNGLENIYKVTIDLTSIGGDGNQKMYDNGKFGDLQVDDGTYSYEYTVPEDTPSGIKTLQITVLDHTENEAQYQLKLEVLAKKAEGTTAFSPAFESYLLIICLMALLLYFSRLKEKT